MVVALIGDDATLKRFYPEGEMVRLQPANPTMQPIRVPAAGRAGAGHRGRADAEVLSRSRDPMPAAASAPAYDLFADPLGTALAVAEGGSLVALWHLGSAEEAETSRTRHWPDAVRDPDAPPLPALRDQLAEYFAGGRRAFDLPLDPRGSAFQQSVWQALQDIPYGATRSYADIARAVGSPGSARAVGGANHDNPIGVVIPCHRVIGAAGALTGYAGGLDRKRLLLELEGALPPGLPFESPADHR